MATEAADQLETIQFADSDVGLWIVAVLLYVPGDVLTTVYAISHLGAGELNPIAEVLLITTGIEALIVLKAVVFGIVILLYQSISPAYRQVVPASIGLVGLAAVAWNLMIITTMI